MAVVETRARDVIFTFDNSCNSKCCRWWTCCIKKDLEDDDAVYVSPRGNVKRFDFDMAPSADVNAKRTLVNLEARLTQLAQNQSQIQAVIIAIQHQMNLNIQQDVRILRTTDVRRIEQLALPILRAPSPEPVEPPPTPRIERHSSQLVRSQKMRDIRLEEVEVEHSEAVQEEV